MTSHQPLKSASELAKKNGVDFPDKSGEYRRARDLFLAEEIELRHPLERVAGQRCALPPGSAIPKEYRLYGENREVVFSDLFGDKQTLVV